MYSDTRLGQIMKGLPRAHFERFVREENADKYNKGFRSWDQLIAMIFNQLSGASSLRELEAGFNSQQQVHYHLGTRCIKRSTLADANANRSSDLFSKICNGLINDAHRRLKREMRTLVYLLDSSPIHLQGRHFDEWASQYKNNISQGMKLHVLMEQQAKLPVYAVLSGANESDVRHGHRIPIEAGATYVFDKGYYDYNWWHSIEEQGGLWVTRLKRHAAFNVVEQREPSDTDTILEDSTIEFTVRYLAAKKPNHYRGKPLRRIIVARPDKDTPMVLVTNDFTRSAESIANLYKQRWDIELFFKWIKQNLKIKRFLGRSQNAVKTQIYIALITYLLLHLYRVNHGLKAAGSLLVCQIKVGLFQRPETDYAVAERRRREREALIRRQGTLFV